MLSLSQDYIFQCVVGRDFHLRLSKTFYAYKHVHSVFVAITFAPQIHESCNRMDPCCNYRSTHLRSVIIIERFSAIRRYSIISLFRGNQITNSRSASWHIKNQFIPCGNTVLFFAYIYLNV